MKRSFLLFFLVLSALVISGCAKPKRLSVEEEYRRRQERRMKAAERKRRDKITSLSGLNAVELEELERSKKENDLNPNPGAFVFSVKPKDSHGTGRILKELNEDGQKKVKQYNDDVRQKNKSGKSWVYGI